MSRKTLLLFAFSLLVPIVIIAESVENVDLQVIHKIKTAVLNTGGQGGFGGPDGPGGGGGRGGGGRAASPGMTTMYNLTDRYGPRLTNSPQFRPGGGWGARQPKERGLA